MMKFSKSTLAILKSFCTISPGIIFEPGDVIQVARKNDSQTMARAAIDSTIDATLPITDLPQFISILSTFDDPELTVEGKFVLVQEGRRKLKYKLGFPGLISTFPYAAPALNDPLTTFILAKDELQKITRIAGTLSSPFLAFVGRGGEFFIEASNIKDKTANESVYSHQVETTTPVTEDFTLVFEGEKFNWFQATDLDITVTKRLTKFVGKPITYWSSYLPKYSEIS